VKMNRREQYDGFLKSHRCKPSREATSHVPPPTSKIRFANCKAELREGMCAISPESAQTLQRNKAQTSNHAPAKVAARMPTRNKEGESCGSRRGKNDPFQRWLLASQRLGTSKRRNQRGREGNDNPRCQQKQEFRSRSVETIRSNTPRPNASHTAASRRNHQAEMSLPHRKRYPSQTLS